MRLRLTTRWPILRLALLLCLASSAIHTMAQELPAPEEILLWARSTPGMNNVCSVEVRKERGDSKTPNAWIAGVIHPTLTVYQPVAKNRNGTAVVVCPGGGYAGLAIDKEGHEIARWFQNRGVVAAVLKYRTAPFASFSLKDAQRALRMMRNRAEEWHIEPNRIGIMGFSAGGHLASTAGTHDDSGDSDAKDPIDRVSCHADFMVLVYPVISMQEGLTHQGSRKNLLGENPGAEWVELLSNERQVNAETAPTFLVHGGDDQAVPVENSLAFYSALRKHKVPAELHVFEHGRHGFGMRARDQPVGSWPQLLEAWLEGRGILKPSQ